MSLPILQIEIRSEEDFILARQRARKIASLAGFSVQDQTRITTAVSEIVRHTLQHTASVGLDFRIGGRAGFENGSSLEIAVNADECDVASVRRTFQNSASNWSDVGLYGARRLMDGFQMESRADSNVLLSMVKALPPGAPEVTPQVIAQWRDILMREVPDSPLREVERQNREMLRTLEELRAKELELARQLEEADRLNSELDRTNQGVISLYNEIEDKNAELRHEIQERESAEQKLRVTMQELERSNAELESFAYVASHDLQEPLRMISSFLQLLEAEHVGGLDAEAREYIRFAVGGAVRMQDLIEDLLTYSRVGRKGKPFTSTDLGCALDTVIEDIGKLVVETGTRITRDALPTVYADPTQMMQLLSNLIRNAIKFRKPDEPPRVHVGAREESHEWIVWVADNGIGIEPQYFERIFVIFQRLHARDEYPGTGIGLAVCKRIVERHGGRIWVESESGKGSTFFFSIPKRQDQGAHDQGQETRHPSDRGQSG
ncbi:ATP-binding protein [Desulfocurvibacter africanus]|uniref:ATP-binding protein n=1 Tax=Desulfocurvibacter africanus TaxID=873 RepID=UPI0004145ABB|nr:ATP-binding protein [Desulfocurvibacter africanus]